MEPRNLYQAALKAARAGVKALKTQTNFSVTKKTGTGNYSTSRDMKVEDVLKDVLRKEAGDHFAFAGEEGGDSGNSQNGRWVIDPIDGTINQVNGLPFGISIGFERDNEMIVGVIAFPTEGVILSAQKGKGSFLTPLRGGRTTKILQRQTLPMERMHVAYDVGYEKRRTQLRKVVFPLASSKLVAYTTCYASVTVGNYYLALGKIAGYVHLTPTIYDVAAASVIIEEMGGVVTTVSGKRINWTEWPQSYLAAYTSEFHQKLLGILN